MNIGKLRVSASHAFNAQFDATVWGAWSYGFDRGSTVTSTMFGVGTLAPTPLSSLNWFEYGLRVGYRLTQTLMLDVFANGVTGEGVIDTKIHAGGGLRAMF